jgi:hypothetical protein
MTTITDEMMGAWLDGEVSQKERQAIEAAIAASPELGMRVARLSRVDRMLAPAYAETLSARIPQRFENLLAEPGQAARIDGFWSRLGQALAPRPMAIAAASLVFGVAVGGVLVSRISGGPAVEVAADGNLIANRAMAASLASAQSGGEGALRIRLSLLDDAGHYCRQFETSSAAGLACLEGDAWKVDTLTAATRSTGAGGLYVMADGSTDPAIAAALQRRGVREVLDRGKEAAAIAAGWQAAK